MKIPPFRLLVMIPQVMQLLNSIDKIEYITVKRKVDKKKLRIEYYVIFENEEKLEKYKEIDDKLAKFLSENL